MKKFNMKKTTAAAVAATVGAVLLLGGAGTLAYWSDTAESNTQAITSGSLEVGAAGDGTWTVKTATTAAKALEGTVVPGDILSTTFSVPVRLDGDNLKATLDITPTIPQIVLANGTKVEPAVFAKYVDVKVAGLGAAAATKVVDGSKQSWTLTPKSNVANTVTVTVTVTVPNDAVFAAPLTSSTMGATLGGIKLGYTLTQIAI